ncbi:MAG TPA: DUF1614 domain-containing protein [Bacillota bacterium]|jgi:uncharacterized membrane protein|nr:DUF1614 domain-containing protein [Bacillota bacterium]HOJ84273.1 DUF1614 domain-containing protein [Bacillota bacterium]HOL14661.1 DUF1614 domain-containing protein [Bacillota bacterium]HPZ11067.1 DUF1614 domain-containing protein [Bacillota bacterium]HQE09723.1 DUF1614 domain-containing protein [Bacillota bacterium]
MPVGMILLLGISILIFLGLAQRVLDRLGLTDRTALLFIAAMLVGGFLPEIPLTGTLSINIGGGLIPIALVVYLFVKAGTARERTRAAVAMLASAVVTYIVLKIFPLEPTYAFLVDPLYLVALIAGVAGYLAGRSRRSAFIAGVGAIVLNDIFTRIELFARGAKSNLVIGGAGIFDAVLVSGLIALGLAELIGEIRERLGGEPGEGYPEELREGLREPGSGRHDGEEGE